MATSFGIQLYLGSSANVFLLRCAGRRNRPWLFACARKENVWPVSATPSGSGARNKLLLIDEVYLTRRRVGLQLKASHNHGILGILGKVKACWLASLMSSHHKPFMLNTGVVAEVDQ